MKKIKGQSKAVKMKYLLYLFAASLVVMLPVRLYQLLALTELDTGFFVGSDFTVTLVYVLALVVPLLFISLSFVSKEVPSPMLPVGKNYALGIASLVFSASLLYDAIIKAFKVIPSAAGSLSIALSVIASNLAESGGAFLLARIIFALLGCVWFLIFAVSNLGGNASYKNYKLLALAPVCWAASRLVTYLTSPISFVNITELMFELYMLMFLMLFLITSARISTGVFSEDGMWGIYGFGLCAAFFGAIVTVPRIVVLIIGRDAVSGYSFEPADLGALIYTVCYIFASFGIGFDEVSQNRRLVSEVVLPEDGVVVRKSASASEEAHDIQNIAPLKEEVHGIFKVEDEVIENAPEEEAVPEAPAADFVKETAFEKFASPVAEEKTEASFENEQVKESLNTESSEASEEFFTLPEEDAGKASSTDTEKDYGELLKGFEESSEKAVTEEKEKKKHKGGILKSKNEREKDNAEKESFEACADDALSFSAEGFFAESGEDEEVPADTGKKNKKASKLDKLRETAESAENEKLSAQEKTSDKEKTDRTADKKALRLEKKAQRSAAKKEKAEKAQAEKARKAAEAEAKKTEKAKKEADARAEKAKANAEKKAFADSKQKNAPEKTEKQSSKKDEKKKAPETNKQQNKAADSKSKGASKKSEKKPDKKDVKVSDKKSEKKQNNKAEEKKKKAAEQKSREKSGLFGKKSEEDAEDEIISAVSLKDMKNGKKN